MDEKKQSKSGLLSDQGVSKPGELVPAPALHPPLVVGSAGSLGEEADSQKEEAPTLRILPSRNLVVFPHNVVPLMAGREWSAQSIDWAVRVGGTLGIVAQKDAKKEPESAEDLYSVGTEVRVVKIIRFPDGSYGAVVQGVKRFRIKDFVEFKPPQFVAEIEYFSEDFDKNNLTVIALGRSLKSLVQKAIQMSPGIPSEAGLFVENVQDPSYLSDLVMPYLSIDFENKQALLEQEDIEKRLEQIHFFLNREVEILEISNRIQTDVRSEVGKQQRKYFVKEQMKQLQKELAEIDGKETTENTSEPEDLAARVAKTPLPKEAKESAQRELDRMKIMQPGSPEHMVSFTYVSWLLDVPWGKTTQKEVDLAEARAILDKDHYGLEKIKKRILDHLAVYALKKDLKGSILLLSGPPGVGKTSLGRSIARALGRNFVRIALGGVRDEAEIRGHRRTYIGSMPGKLVDALKKAGSMDPVILLDEVDKMSADGRGDPASALLEVLDSEQNHTFTDHYLNVPVDLSKVLFVATANMLSAIPAPLRDRMEVIELGSYTLQEKAHIAFDHLLPQALDENGLTGKAKVKINAKAMNTLIQQYTREAGVRQLKRELSGLARGVAREVVEKQSSKQSPKQSAMQSLKQSAKVLRKPLEKSLSVADLKAYLGNAPFPETPPETRLPPGVATGLAWTPVGGDVLLVETVFENGIQGRLTITGQLGEVMQESVRSVLSFLRSRAVSLGIDPELLKKDIHVHFPAGAVRKDGPSAGVAILSALMSLFSGKPISTRIAMTGEISLRGQVLPVGGIKEKLIAAHRNRVEKVLIPAENARDLEDLPAEVRKELKVIPVSTMEQVLVEVFGKPMPAVRKSAKPKMRS